MKHNAIIKIDDAFHPKHMEFTECGDTIEFFNDGESIRVQCYRGDKKQKDSFIMGMHIPLYARIAFAQMFAGALNGKRLLDDQNK